MPLVVERAYNPATDGAFAINNPRMEASGRRVLARDDQGSLYHAYQAENGRIECAAMVQPSAAKQAADAASLTALAADRTKGDGAVTVVRNQVARVRAIPAGSRTDQDRWLLALSWLLFKEE